MLPVHRYHLMLSILWPVMGGNSALPSPKVLQVTSVSSSVRGLVEVKEVLSLVKVRTVLSAKGLIAAFNVKVSWSPETAVTICEKVVLSACLPVTTSFTLIVPTLLSTTKVVVLVLMAPFTKAVAAVMGMVNPVLGSVISITTSSVKTPL